MTNKLIAQSFGNILGRNTWELRETNNPPTATNYSWLFVYSEEPSGAKPFYGARRWRQSSNAGNGAWLLQELGVNATKLRANIDAAITRWKESR